MDSAAVKCEVDMTTSLEYKNDDFGKMEIEFKNESDVLDDITIFDEYPGNNDNKNFESDIDTSGKIKCPWCDKVFAKVSGTFAQHRKTEHFWGVFRCPSCKYRANFAKDLIQHMEKKDHVDNPLTGCPKCKSEFPLLEIGEHFKECALRKNIKCQWCPKVFQGMSGGLDMHRKKKHFWGIFKCQECKVILNFAKELVDHMKHSGHNKEPFANCPKCKDKYPMLEIGPHYEKCISADDKKKKLSDTDSGNAPKWRKRCPVCQEVSTDIQWHKKRKHFWGAFYCPQCLLKTNFAKDLVEHMQETGHVEDPQLTCPQCKEKFHMLELASHYETCVEQTFKRKIKKRNDKSGRPMTCETCGKVVSGLSYKYHIKTHLRAKGGDEENGAESLWYYCDKCGKRFTKRDGLRKHIKLQHEGVKSPSTCPICLLTFDSQHKMFKHKTMEHSTDEKYQCGYCGKRCSTTAALRSHKLRHEPPKFKCSFCEKMLKTEVALLVHEREHTGERPFECDVCRKGFKSLSILATHTKHVHKIVKPHMKPLEKRVRKDRH